MRCIQISHIKCRSSHVFHHISHFDVFNIFLRLTTGGSNGMMDFLAVSLINGYVAVAISLGGRSSSFNLRNGRRLDDGSWHHVEIKRMKKV